jgi:hypothetical protein
MTETPKNTEDTKTLPLKKIIGDISLSSDKDSQAEVVVDDEGTPQTFVFNTWGLLDVLSTIDNAFEKKLDAKEYHSKTANPAGWLIDEIESKLPLSKDYKKKLKSIEDDIENATPLTDSHETPNSK